MVFIPRYEKHITSLGKKWAVTVPVKFPAPRHCATREQTTSLKPQQPILSLCDIIYYFVYVIALLLSVFFADVGKNETKTKQSIQK